MNHSVTLTYSFRVEHTATVEIEADNALEAERVAVAESERIALLNPGSSDFDVSEITVVAA